MDPVVRVASADDAGELQRLESVSREALQPVRGGALRLQECTSVDDWNRLVDDADTWVAVGTLDDVVLAYMVMQLRRDRDRGVITHAFVEDGARELGLGDTLVEHAVELCRTHRLSGIEAVALPGDRDTKNLYERAGLTARKITVYKSLLAEP